MTDAEWLESTVKLVTARPSCAEYVPAMRSGIFGGMDAPAVWRITIKGVESTPHIQIARVTLRDEEHVLARVVACLPEIERAPVAAHAEEESKPS